MKQRLYLGIVLGISGLFSAPFFADAWIGFDHGDLGAAMFKSVMGIAVLVYVLLMERIANLFFTKGD